MATLITEASGCIGYHLARRLLAKSELVIGIDDLKDHYSPKVKANAIEDLTRGCGERFIFRGHPCVGQHSCRPRATEARREHEPAALHYQQEPIRDPDGNDAGRSTLSAAGGLSSKLLLLQTRNLEERHGEIAAVKNGHGFQPTTPLSLGGRNSPAGPAKVTVFERQR